MAGFFLVLFAGLQFILLTHHHADETGLSHEHSVKQHCEICLYAFGKQHHFLAPTGVQIPEASILTLTKKQFQVIVAVAKQVHFQFANRGPPVI